MLSSRLEELQSFGRLSLNNYVVWAIWGAPVWARRSTKSDIVKFWRDGPVSAYVTKVVHLSCVCSGTSALLFQRASSKYFGFVHVVLISIIFIFILFCLRPRGNMISTDMFVILRVFLPLLFCCLDSKISASRLVCLIVFWFPHLSLSPAIRNAQFVRHIVHLEK